MKVVIVKVPVIALTVSVGVMATPLPLVFTVALPVNDPLAPVLPAVMAKVTAVPAITGLPLLSFTVACSAVAKAKLICALCGVPAVAATDAAGPRLFVSEKGAA